MKKIIYTGLVLASFLLFTSSQKRHVVPTLDELRENLFVSNTCTWYDEEKEGKKEVVFSISNKYGNSKQTPHDQCTGGSSIALRYLFAVENITGCETWYNPKSFYKNSQFHQNFTTIFGVNPIDKVIPDANGKKETGFRFFNVKAMETIFTKLYAKPSTKYQGVAYQKVYDLSLKTYVADMASVIASILKDKKKFEKVAQEYLDKAKKDKNFNGIDATDTYRQTHFAELSFACKNYDDTKAINRLLGIMLRRQSDGTLKVILGAFKNMLKDYDKETFEKYKNAF